MKKFSLLLLVAAAVAAGFWFGAHRGASSSGERPAVAVPEGAIENDPRRPGAVGKRAPGLEEALLGEWRSLDDLTFTRVFEAGGKFHDTYQGEPAGAPGTWELTSDGSEELRLASEGDTMRFHVVAVTEESLTLTYLGRGNSLRFERVR
jgi:hypothetical protein